jgi:hypothetical protein
MSLERTFHSIMHVIVLLARILHQKTLVNCDVRIRTRRQEGKYLCLFATKNSCEASRGFQQTKGSQRVIYGQLLTGSSKSHHPGVCTFFFVTVASHSSSTITVSAHRRPLAAVLWTEVLVSRLWQCKQTHN